MRLRAYSSYTLKVPGEAERVVDYLFRVRKGWHRVVDPKHRPSVFREVKREWICELKPERGEGVRGF